MHNISEETYGKLPDKTFRAITIIIDWTNLTITNSIVEKLYTVI